MKVHRVLTRTRALRGVRASMLAAIAAVAACGAAEAVSPAAGATIETLRNPLAGLKLFVDGNWSPARKQADLWRAARPADATLMDRIAGQPIAKWMNGWSDDVRREVASIVSRAAAAGTTPVFVAYNIPNRDCGSYSAGGLSASGYRSWVRDFAAGLSGRTIVILEPDAIGGAGCLSEAARNERYDLLRDAVKVFKAANAIVYVDAGNASWHSPDAIATRLAQAGIAEADGFSLNVSNYISTAASVRYGDAVSARVGGKHYIIDTSRNGLGGVPGEWCNVPGQALGQLPTTSTGRSLVDAYVWVKYPGESDGTCNGGPRSGQWWGDYALGLAQRAVTVASAN